MTPDGDLTYYLLTRPMTSQLHTAYTPLKSSGGYTVAPPMYGEYEDPSEWDRNRHLPVFESPSASLRCLSLQDTCLKQERAEPII